MLPFALTLFGLAVGALLLFVYLPIGFPVVIIALIGLVVVAIRSFKGEKALGTIERERKVEPTGQPRPSTTGPETANQRQGQV